MSNLFVSLSQLLESGIPIIKALQTLIPVSPRSTQTVLVEMLGEIESGESLETAMKRQPGAFKPQQIAVIAAAERRGDLGAACSRVADGIKRSIAARRKVRRIVAYPVGLIAFSFVVLPIKELVIGDRGLYFSSVALGLGILAAVVLGCYGLVKYGATASAIRRLAWSVPIVSGIYLAFLRGRFYRTLSSHIDAGLGMRESLTTAGAVCNDPEAERRVALALGEIDAGKGLSVSLLRARISSEIEAPLLASGETSGKLVETLNAAALDNELRAQRGLKVATVAFSTILMVVVLVVLAKSVIDGWVGVIDDTYEQLDNLR
jgi:general secretion pathway protein F